MATTKRIHLTIERIRKLPAPDGNQAVYVFDDDPRHLSVRTTPAGVKAFVYCGKLTGAPIRITIGSVDTWNLDDARAEARRLQTMVDVGTDPRIAKAEKLAETVAKQNIARQIERPALEVWNEYIEARRHRWSTNHLADHENVAKEGGKMRTRGRRPGEPELTQPGSLRPLLLLPLSKIDPDTVRDWLKAEATRRPTHARLAFGLLRAFLNWCSDQKEYRALAHADACAPRTAKDQLPKKAAKNDCLQREQLPAWFEQVRAIANPVIANYLQIALLTGARREEIAGLMWADIDFQWNTIRMQDKVEGERTIPLTPYVANLLLKLKMINDAPPLKHRILNGKKIENDLSKWAPSQWVFASKTAKSGRLQEPRIQHTKACAEAGISNLTIHGLRRSFGTLAEWVECPAGIVAQIQGHKPSATAEKHYRVRPIDLLRMWHTKIESWMLKQANITFEKPLFSSPKRNSRSS